MLGGSCNDYVMIHEFVGPYILISHEHILVLQNLQGDLGRVSPKV